jgi:hypothetical protein
VSCSLGDVHRMRQSANSHTADAFAAEVNVKAASKVIRYLFPADASTNGLLICNSPKGLSTQLSHAIPISLSAICDVSSSGTCSLRLSK